MGYFKSLFLTVIACAGLYFGTIIGLAPLPIKGEYWVRELVTVKRYLANQLDRRPRIFVLGGSSALFGIDAKTASEQLGVPVLNFGSHAGLDLASILNTVRPVVTDGDAIILALEPPYYCEEEGDISEWQARNDIAWNREAWQSMRLPQKVNAAVALNPLSFFEVVTVAAVERLRPQLLWRRQVAFDDDRVVEAFRNGQYDALAAAAGFGIDHWGDVQNARAARFVGRARDPRGLDKVCPRSFAMLQQFRSDMASRGVSIYFANTPYVDDPSINEMDIDRADDALRLQLDPLSCFIDRRRDLLLDRRFFFDTDLHLNESGRALRTPPLVRGIHDQVLSRRCNGSVAASGSMATRENKT